MSKMPSYLQDKWLREADRLTQQGRTIRFGSLVEFLTVEVRVKTISLSFSLFLVCVPEKVAWPVRLLGCPGTTSTLPECQMRGQINVACIVGIMDL